MPDGVQSGLLWCAAAPPGGQQLEQAKASGSSPGWWFMSIRGQRSAVPLLLSSDGCAVHQAVNQNHRFTDWIIYWINELFSNILIYSLGLNFNWTCSVSQNLQNFFWFLSPWLKPQQLKTRRSSSRSSDSKPGNYDQ